MNIRGDPGLTQKQTMLSGTSSGVLVITLQLTSIKIVHSMNTFKEECQISCLIIVVTR